MKKGILLSIILPLILCSCTAHGDIQTEEPAVYDTGDETTAADDTSDALAVETGETEVTEEVKTFKNPISDRSMPDPFIVYHDGYYYGLATEVTVLNLYRGKSVEELFLTGESRQLIKTGDGIGGGKTLGWNIWAPELHYAPSKGKWYVYACASTDGFDFGAMRMFCLESEGDDPFGEYTFKGLTLKTQIGIDQTVYYDDSTGNLYTAYCEFTQDRGQVITLAAMSEPWRVGTKRVTVTYPQYDWEKRGTDENNDGRVNEGPVFLKYNGQIYLIYSASGCWSEWYCLGALRYTGEDTTKRNFLDPDNWEKSDKPLFSEANGVYGVGHCAFFTSPDGSELWMSYHGMATPDAGVNGRYAYVQRIEFTEDGWPALGEPLSRDTEIKVPSGQ